MKSLRFGLPDIDEQRRIVSAINEGTATITRTIAHTQREIDLLTEFRTRVTSDVVTGQVDVRAIAATLPDIDEMSVADGSIGMEDSTYPEEVDDHGPELAPMP